MLNKQITEGRMTSNPELKTTPAGVSVCTFTVASDEDTKREDGSRVTDFIDCVAWRRTAEFAARYLTKGRLIIVEGRPKPRVYKDKNGTTHKVTELRVDNIYFAESRKETSQSPADQGAAAAPGYESGDFEEITDQGDLPF